MYSDFWSTIKDLGISDIARQRLRRALKGLATGGPASYNLTRLIERTSKECLVQHVEKGHTEIAVFCCYSPYLSLLLLKEADLLLNHDQYNQFRESLFDVVSFEIAFNNTIMDAGDDKAKRLKILRLYKDRAFLKIAIQDFLGVITLERAMLYLTRLASLLLEASLNLSIKDMQKKHGSILSIDDNDKEANVVPFCIFGLGKLGGKELNYHSDIDIMFAYGTDRGLSESGITPHEYFSIVAKDVIYYLQEYTDNAFVYRVDTRLRPEGMKGPLVNSLRSLEISYESWGQTWERLALSKMTPVAGDKEFGWQVIKTLEPFIYRRYLDFTTISDISQIKAKIEHKSSRKAGFIDLKLGVGGIREIEFIIQTLGLIHGGKHKNLRQKSTLIAIKALKEAGYLYYKDAVHLTKAYAMMRQFEHALQLKDGLQTHLLPLSPDQFTPIARAAYPKINPERIKSLQNTLFEYMNAIHEIYQSIFAKESLELKNNVSKEAKALALGNFDNDIREFILKKGFEDTEDAIRRFMQLREGVSKRSLTSRSKSLLDQIIPKVIDLILQAPIPSLALIHAEHFFSLIAGKTSYYALFKENPQILEVLIKLFGSSSYLSHFLLNHPNVLESLVGEDLTKIYDRESFINMVEMELANQDSFEDAMIALRSFKNASTLKIAMLDLTERINIDDVLCMNSAVAEICLLKATKLCLEEMVRKYGNPWETDGIPFFVIAMGNLGSVEIGYGSDIDMIFLYDDVGTKNDLQNFYTFITRLGQRILRAISVTTTGGYLYRVDTRLRPRGRQGTLVSSIERFAEFNAKEAGVFERMVMFKARIVYGNVLTYKKKIFPIIDSFLWGKPLSVNELTEALRLRARMEEELVSDKHNKEKGYHIKWGKGGLLDVEFLTIWILMTFGSSDHSVRANSTIAGLKTLGKQGLILQDDASFLVNHYRFLRTLENRMRLIHDLEIDNIDFNDPKVRDIMHFLLHTSTFQTSTPYISGKLMLKECIDRARSIYALYTTTLQNFLEGQNVSKARWINEIRRANYKPPIFK